MEDKLALSERLAIYSELMAGIAHQLNNPMVGVINFSGLLLGKIAADDPNRKVAETIYEAAKECQRLLASLMKSIHEPQSTFHDVNVGEVLDSALNATWNHESFNLADVQLKKLIPGVIPKIKGDSLQLLEVFRNILINAFQAMPDGGWLDIGIKVALKEKEIKVWFKDTGHGISKENLSRIFTPFFSTKKNKGAGLGLSFAFQVIRSHSGRIVVKSMENRGTTFVIVLPIHTEEGRFEYFDKS
jgi:two-component system NtrC family sensor kinase